MQRNESSSASASPRTRRELLALSAAAAGAGWLAAGPAAAQPRGWSALQQKKVRAAPKPGEPIRIGVIGIGAPSTPAMGFGHCQRICALAKEGKEQVLIVAVSDVAKPYLARGVELCSKEQGIEVSGYRDYRELLAREDLHGVLIATPEHWHAQMAIDAINAGLDVYLEKPMTKVRPPKACR
jgi:hypothetical protein